VIESNDRGTRIERVKRAPGPHRVRPIETGATSIGDAIRRLDAAPSV